MEYGHPGERVHRFLYHQPELPGTHHNWMEAASRGSEAARQPLVASGVR